MNKWDKYRASLAFFFLAVLVLPATGYGTFRYHGAEYLETFSEQSSAPIFQAIKGFDVQSANYPAKEAFAPLERARINNMSGLMVVLSASGVVIWLVTKRLTKPLVLLTAYVRDADPAHSVRQLGIPLRGKIGVLARTFEEKKQESFRQQALADEQLKFLQTIIDTIPHPVYYQGVDRRITGCNASFALVVERSAEQIIGKPLNELLSLPNMASNRCQDDDLLPNGAQVVCSYEEHLSTGTGEERDLLLYKAIFRDIQGRPAGLVGTLIDITDRKTLEDALLVKKKFFESLLQNSAVVVHRAGTVLFANIAAARLFGASSPDQLQRREIMTLLHPDSRADWLKRFDIVGTSLIDESYIEERILRLDGDELEVESISAPVYYGGAWSVQTILRDITQRKEQQELVWRQANYDTLTQIPNRMLFNDRLRQAVELSLREQKPCGVMYIDLDGFKAINDNLGHDAGDMLLREFAERLTGIIRKSDTVARLGGDEFAVIISNLVEPTNVGVIARHILSELARPFQLAGASRKISGSIGVAMFPSDADDIQTLIKCADSAMYRAKQGGKNAFCLFAKDDAESFSGAA